MFQQVVASLQMTSCHKPDCCNLMKLTSLLQLVDKLQPAGKINHLQEVCGVFGCVFMLMDPEIRKKTVQKP